MSRLKKILEKQEFEPSVLGFFTNPFYFARREIFVNIRNLATKMQGRILDVGCGTKPYLKLFKNIEYVGLEVDTPKNREKKRADFFYDGKNFPFKDNEFDGILTSEVLEHVFHPDLFLKELNRVLRPGGTLLLTTPFMWEEHEQPHDFGRYSSFGLRFILERSGFGIVEQRKTLNDFRAILQLLNCQIRKLLKFIHPKLRLICYIPTFGILNALGFIMGFLLPKHNDFYIDNIVLARKK